MTKEFFEEVMRIPSVSKHEDMMIEFLMDWGSKHGCKTRKDGKGNVYMEKGSGIRPTLCNHVDTVHNDQKEMVEQKVYKEIVWDGDHVTAKNPLTGKQTGLGMDNQGGACIALAVIDRLKNVKAIFTVEEEIGMVGIRNADFKFFDDSAFVISNDSPDENRATHYSSGVQLYSDKFFKDYLEPICKKHGVTSFRSEPFTCIKVIRSDWTDKDGKHLECLNFGNAGDKPHSDQEGASFKGVNNAEALLYALCTGIPTDKQYTSDIEEEPRPTYSSGFSGYSDWWDRTYGNRASDSGWWDRWKKDRSSGKASQDDLPGFDAKNARHSDKNMECVVRVKFSSEAALKDAISDMAGENVDVTAKKINPVTLSITGTLAEVQKAYVLAYNAEHGTDYASWKHLKDDGAESGFWNSVVKSEEPETIDVDVDDDIPTGSEDDEIEDFWNWYDS